MVTTSTGLPRSRATTAFTCCMRSPRSGRRAATPSGTSDYDIRTDVMAASGDADEGSEALLERVGCAGRVRGSAAMSVAGRAGEVEDLAAIGTREDRGGPAGEFFGVVAGLAESCRVVEAGLSAFGDRGGVVGVPDRGVTPWGGTGVVGQND